MLFIITKNELYMYKIICLISILCELCINNLKNYFQKTKFKLYLKFKLYVTTSEGYITLQYTADLIRRYTKYSCFLEKNNFQ